MSSNITSINAGQVHFKNGGTSLAYLQASSDNIVSILGSDNSAAGKLLIADGTAAGHAVSKLQMETAIAAGGNEELAFGPGLSVGVDGFTVNQGAAAITSSAGMRVFFATQNAGQGNYLKYVSAASRTGTTITLSTDFAASQVDNGDYVIFVNEGATPWAVSAVKTISAVDDVYNTFVIDSETGVGTSTLAAYIFTGASPVIDITIYAEPEPTGHTISQVAANNINGTIPASAVVLSRYLQGSGVSADGSTCRYAALSYSTYSGSNAGLVLALDIDGMTTLGETLVTGALFIVDNAANGTNRKVTLDTIDEYLKATAKTLTNKTLTAPTMTNATVSSGGLTVTAGGLVVTAGGLTVTDGGLAVNGSDNLTLGAGSSIYLTAGQYIGTSGDTDLMQISDNAVTILGTTTSTTFVTSSDRDLKRDVAQCGGLGVMKQLRGVGWTWKSDGTRSLGVIAQEVQEVLPELVHSGSNGLGVNYIGMFGVVINAINDLSGQVEALQHAYANSV